MMLHFFQLGEKRILKLMYMYMKFDTVKTSVYSMHKLRIICVKPSFYTVGFTGCPEKGEIWTKRHIRTETNVYE